MIGYFLAGLICGLMVGAGCGALLMSLFVLSGKRERNEEQIKKWTSES